MPVEFSWAAGGPLNVSSVGKDVARPHVDMVTRIAGAGTSTLESGSRGNSGPDSQRHPEQEHRLFLDSSRGWNFDTRVWEQ